MGDILDVKVNEFMAKVIAKNPGESEFHQAVKEVAESIFPFSPSSVNDVISFAEFFATVTFTV